ncbi:MAG: hypothetical protein IJA89_06870 [Clostridia bacterium]|nr:hypothetical protein [Clostridia bacterium]
MGRRKLTQADVDQAYEVAAEAKKNALFSMRRAKQLRDGADKMKKDYKNSLKRQSRGGALRFNAHAADRKEKVKK